MRKEEILAVLERYNLAPTKARGQNFLFDHNLMDAMVRAMGLQSGEQVLEVGPGLGALTRRLLQADCRLTAIEADAGLVRYLRENLADERMQLHHADACKVDYASLPQLQGDFRCIANLPYNISSVFIAAMLELAKPPQEMYFLLQLEMAQRLAASPGSKDYGGLSVRVQALYEVKILRVVPPEVFHPAPSVKSGFVRLVRRPAPPPQAVLACLGKAVRLGFGQRRKMMRKLLLAGFAAPAVDAAYERAGIAASARAEELDVPTFLSLAAALLALEAGPAP